MVVIVIMVEVEVGKAVESFSCLKEKSDDDFKKMYSFI